MNNSRFGDDGFYFVNDIIEKIKLGWKTYLIIGLINAGLLSILLGTFIGAFFQWVKTNNSLIAIFSIVPILIAVCIIISLSLACNAGNIKCISDTKQYIGFVPSAEECIRFGVSKLAKLIVLTIVLFIINTIFSVVYGAITSILMLITFGLASIIIIPLSFIIGVVAIILIDLITLYVVIQDMTTMEAIKSTINEVLYGLKENMIFILKISAIVLLVTIFSPILNTIPILGSIVIGILMAILNLGILIATYYRFL